MVNLADLDTSFLVPCRHCGDLLPEQDRICPHCGKDQSVAPAKGGPGMGAGSLGLPPHGVAASDPLAMAGGERDFTGVGFGGTAVDHGVGRSRRKAIGIVALLAGVLLLGMAYDRYAKQGTTTPPVPVPVSMPVPVPMRAQEAPPVTAMPSSTPPSTPSTPPKESAPAATETPSPGCSEALAALSLCTKP